MNLNTKSNNKSRSKWSIVALLLVLALVLSACNSAAKSGSKTASGDEGTPVSGGKIVVAWGANPANLDPDQNTTPQTNEALSHVYEGLFEFDASYKAVPYLAESYEFRDGSKTLNVKLRQGVKFHNGKELTTEDVEASFKRWLELNGSGVIVKPYFESFESVGKYEFNFKFNKPYAPFLSILASNSANQKLLIKPKELVEKTGKDILKEQIGTGPYEFVDWVPDRSLKLKKFKDYKPLDTPSSGYAGKRIAYADEIEFKYVPELAVRVAGVQTNEYQFADDVSLDQYSTYKADPQVTPIIASPGLQNHFVFNLGIAPFNNLEARKAVLYGVNIEELATAMVGNKDFWHYNASFFEEVNIWHDDKAGEGIYNTYDLEKAKAALKASGYDGKPIVILDEKSNKAYADGAIVLKAQLEKVGFKVDVQLLDSATVAKQLADKENITTWNATLTSFKVPKPDPQVYAAWLGTDKWITKWKDESATRMDAIFERLLVETDYTKRFAIVQDWYKEFWTSIPFVRTFDYDRLHLANKSLKGYANYSTPYYWNVWVDKK